MEYVREIDMNTIAHHGDEAQNDGVPSKLTYALHAGQTTISGKDYYNDPKGGFTPSEMVKPEHKLEDETVRRVMHFARVLSDQIARFKGHTFEDLNGFQSLLEQEYGAKKGGAKGNVTYQSYDGLMKVQVQIADQISFGPQLQTAKSLLDECLMEWGAESRPEIRALVDRVFSVGKEGQINRAELFGLLRLDITDERWVRAMTAIRDSIRVTGTKSYIRFYSRPSADAGWSAITIDLAAA
jgi:Protein of unknown function (DUF3164)